MAEAQGDLGTRGRAQTGPEGRAERRPARAGPTGSCVGRGCGRECSPRPAYARLSCSRGPRAS
eukprot:1075643-Alexandrium_andersonii.AAC.1